MKSLRQSLALVGLSLTLTASGCTGGDVLPASSPSTSQSSAINVTNPSLPNAAQPPLPVKVYSLPGYVDWHRSVTQSAADAQLPTLPALNSPELRQELDEIYNLQSRLNDQIKARLAYWDAGGVLRWNEIARQLVAKTGMPPPLAARAYALLSVTHYLTVQAVRDWQTRLPNRQTPAQMDARIHTLGASTSPGTCPSEEAALATASQAVLQFLFPGEAYAIGQSAQEQKEARIWAGQNVRSDLAAGDAIGRVIALNVIDRARLDGATAKWTGSVPTFAGAWHSISDKPPLLPLWGQTQAWFLTRNDQFRAPPHPEVNSPEFIQAVQEVRDLTLSRSAEQARIAAYWADGAGTSTPPGHWNLIATQLIAEQKLDPLQAAKILATLNMAMMDVGIAVWETKYYYWLLRPSMSEPAVNMTISLPNFPSYTSGHSGFSGAASEILRHFFPAQKASLQHMAEEASLSRVYGGIHYRFDCVEGLKQGRAIAALAIQTMDAP